MSIFPPGYLNSHKDDADDIININFLELIAESQYMKYDRNIFFLCYIS